MFVTIIATGLAVGVLIDAFFVRMSVIPATLARSGNAAWWIPTWLDRILPRIDAEGSALTTHASELSTRNDESPRASPPGMPGPTPTGAAERAGRIWSVVPAIPTHATYSSPPAPAFALNDHRHPGM